MGVPNFSGFCEGRKTVVTLISIVLSDISYTDTPSSVHLLCFVTLKRIYKAWFLDKPNEITRKE